MGGITLLCIACLTIMVGAVLAPGLLSIAAALGVSDSAAWLITLPSLGAVLFAPLAGRLIDRHGAYRCLVAGLALYGAIGVAGVLLHGAVPVFANRVVLGGVTALVMAGGTTLISEWYSGHARLNMIAKQGMSIELGGVIFLAVGGLLATLSWRWPFVLYLMSWVFLAMLLAIVPANSPPTDETAPPAGEDKSVPAALKIVYLAAAMAMTVFFTAVVMLPARLHELAFSEAETGYFLSFISLVAVASALMMPRVSRRLGEQRTLILAFVLYALGHATFYLTGSVPILMYGAVVMGIAFGLSVPLVNHMTIERSHAQYRGRNLSYLTMALFLGQFMASFMEFLPGDAAEVFAFAAVLSMSFAILFFSADLISRPGRTTQAGR